MTMHTVVRLMHDLGAATWFGGSLMGATGLNGAAAELDDPTQRARASTAGWSRWAPVGGAAVITHLLGAGGLAVTDSPRVVSQRGVGRSTAVKTGLTAAGLGVSAWSAALNRKMASAGDVPVAGATEVSASTPEDVAKAMRQLKLVQWLNPLVAGAVIATGSWQSEQQRATQVVPGVVKRVGTSPALALPLVGAVAAGTLLARKRKGSSSSTRSDEVRPLPPVDWHSDTAKVTTRTGQQPVVTTTTRRDGTGGSTQAT
jgi:hypothetical protein